MNQPSTLTTAFVTGVGGVLASLAIAWAAKNGLTLTPEQQQALTVPGAVAIGAATDWIVAIISSFVLAVVALNNAIANRAGDLVDKLGGLKPWRESKSADPAKPQAGFARLELLVAIAVLAIMAACAKPAILNAPAEKDLPQPAQVAQTAINAARSELAVVYTFLRDGVTAKTIAIADALTVKAKADELKSNVDQAQRLLDAGGFDQAKAQAQAAQLLIKILHDQAIAAAKKRQTFDSAPPPPLIRQARVIVIVGWHPAAGIPHRGHTWTV